jgi:hypothetical protein
MAKRKYAKSDAEIRRHKAARKLESDKERYLFGLLNIICLFSGPDGKRRRPVDQLNKSQSGASK